MTLGRHFVTIDLFTDAYRVSGRTQVATSGLLSELNNPNTDYLALEDAYLSRMHEPGRIIANYAVASFRKDNINFIVLQDRRDGTVVGTSHARSVFSRGQPVNVFLTIPAFEITGEVMHDGKPEPSTILIHTLGHFQPIFAGRASAALYPDISYSGDMILVRKERIGILCLQRDES